jgi:hypothetical protein
VKDIGARAFPPEKESGFPPRAVPSVTARAPSNKRRRHNDRHVAGTLSGGNVGLTAGRDVQITAANILADQDLTLLAGGATPDPESGRACRTFLGSASPRSKRNHTINIIPAT